MVVKLPSNSSNRHMWENHFPKLQETSSDSTKFLKKFLVVWAAQVLKSRNVYSPKLFKKYYADDIVFYSFDTKDENGLKAASQLINLFESIEKGYLKDIHIVIREKDIRNDMYAASEVHSLSFSYGSSIYIDLNVDANSEVSRVHYRGPDSVREAFGKLLAYTAQLGAVLKPLPGKVRVSLQTSFCPKVSPTGHCPRSWYRIGKLHYFPRKPQNMNIISVNTKHHRLDATIRSVYMETVERTRRAMTLMAAEIIDKEEGGSTITSDNSLRISSKIVSDSRSSLSDSNLTNISNLYDQRPTAASEKESEQIERARKVFQNATNDNTTFNEDQDIFDDDDVEPMQGAEKRRESAPIQSPIEFERNENSNEDVFEEEFFCGAQKPKNSYDSNSNENNAYDVFDESDDEILLPVEVPEVRRIYSSKKQKRSSSSTGDIIANLSRDKLSIDCDEFGEDAMRSSQKLSDEESTVRSENETNNLFTSQVSNFSAGGTPVKNEKDVAKEVIFYSYSHDGAQKDPEAEAGCVLFSNESGSSKSSSQNVEEEYSSNNNAAKPWRNVDDEQPSDIPVIARITEKRPWKNVRELRDPELEIPEPKSEKTSRRKKPVVEIESQGVEINPVPEIVEDKKKSRRPKKEEVVQKQIDVFDGPIEEDSQDDPVSILVSTHVKKIGRASRSKANKADTSAQPASSDVNEKVLEPSNKKIRRRKSGMGPEPMLAAPRGRSMRARHSTRETDNGEAAIGNNTNIPTANEILDDIVHNSSVIETHNEGILSQKSAPAEEMTQKQKKGKRVSINENVEVKEHTPESNEPQESPPEPAENSSLKEVDVSRLKQREVEKKTRMDDSQDNISTQPVGNYEELRRAALVNEPSVANDSPVSDCNKVASFEEPKKRFASCSLIDECLEHWKKRRQDRESLIARKSKLEKHEDEGKVRRKKDDKRQSALEVEQRTALRIAQLEAASNRRSLERKEMMKTERKVDLSKIKETSQEPEDGEPSLKIMKTMRLDRISPSSPSAN